MKYNLASLQPLTMTPISSFSSGTWYYFWIIILMEHGNMSKDLFLSISIIIACILGKENQCEFLSVSQYLYTRPCRVIMATHNSSIFSGCKKCSLLGAGLLLTIHDSYIGIQFQLQTCRLQKLMEQVAQIPGTPCEECAPGTVIMSRFHIKTGSPGRVQEVWLCHKGRFGVLENGVLSLCVLGRYQHPTSPHQCGV